MYWLAGLCVLTVTSSTSLQESKGLMLWRFVMVLNPLFTMCSASRIWPRIMVAAFGSHQ